MSSSISSRSARTHCPACARARSSMCARPSVKRLPGVECEPLRAEPGSCGGLRVQLLKLPSSTQPDNTLG